MKIIHINTTDINGGAARGAYWLHQGLRQLGIDSQMMVSLKDSQDPTVFGPITKQGKLINLIRPNTDPLPLNWYPKRNKHIFSTAWIPTRVHRTINRFNADIVNLHWICGGFVTPESIAKIRQPVVWTLRDMWAFTGGCHYTNECEKYKESCGACPHLASNKKNDLAARLWKRKHVSWADKDIRIVTISHWLAECARQSALFRNKKVEVIPNGIDTSRFKPIPKAIARTIFNLPPDKKIVLFGALKAVKDKRKGFDHLQRALQILSKEGFGKKTEAVVFGANGNGNNLGVGIKLTYMGYLHDDVTLALLYSAADVTVVPSVQEAFGKTAIESMACGTPVACFNSTGLKDIVDHKQNGYRASCFKPDDLAAGIAWIIADEQRWNNLSQHSREKVEKNFSYDIVSRQYLKIYSELHNNLR